MQEESKLRKPRKGKRSEEKEAPRKRQREEKRKILDWAKSERRKHLIGRLIRQIDFSFI